MCPNTQFIVCSWIWISAAALIRVPILTAVHRYHIIIDIEPLMTRRGAHGQTNSLFCDTMWTGGFVYNVYPRIPSHLNALLGCTQICGGSVRA